IAEGNIIWHKLLNDFYQEFAPLVDKAFTDMEKKQPEYTGETCPQCGHRLVFKTGKYGPFTACSNYPACKYIKTEPKEKKEIMKCPQCDGMIIEKKTRKGKIFYGCDNYPKCNFALWDLPTGDKCPECNSLLVKKKDKIKCSKCEYEQN
ncbi:MAG: topoisomerase DNA-binding C4 zinc finger domain-containing protein, partial [Bacilli bacterium]|nr:topoisomerase DNA-binding C4 zinc finger domain-containing protein [Bacilli bacterium]